MPQDPERRVLQRCVRPGMDDYLSKSLEKPALDALLDRISATSWAIQHEN